MPKRPTLVVLAGIAAALGVAPLLHAPQLARSLRPPAMQRSIAGPVARLKQGRTRTDAVLINHLPRCGSRRSMHDIVQKL